MKKTITAATAAAAVLAGALAGPATVQAKGVKGMGDWETTLKPRDIDGDGQVDAWYDTTLNITWLADTQPAGRKSGWQPAMEYIAKLNVKGVKGWRLPTFHDLGAPGCQFSDDGGTDCGYKPDPSSSDMAHMYYVTLGNKGAPDDGWGLVNTGPFKNLKPSLYWTDIEYHPPGESWSFQWDEGRQQRHHNKYNFWSWPVHDGDIPHVNLPGQVD